jgi:two-component system phosphate regulon sensor histidine kinase PhoR
VVPETLRGRLGLTYVIVTLLLIVAIGASILVSIRSSYVNELEHHLNEEALLVADLLGASSASTADPAAIDAIVDRIGVNNRGRVTVLDRTGRVLGDSESDPAVVPNESGLPDVAGAIASGHGSHETDDALSVAVMSPTSPDLIVRVSSPLDSVDSALARVRRDIFGVAMFGALIAGLIAIWVARRITGPLESLRRHAGEVSSGRLDVTTPPVAPREIADLTHSVNSMTIRIRELVLEGERTRTRLEGIFANLTDGVVIIDEEGIVLGLNPSASDMLGANAIWAVGHPFVVVARDHDLVALMDKAFASDEPATGTVDYARNERIIDVFARPVSGPVERFGIVVLHDVTELKRLESVRREFVANVSHELRTPLASIRAVVETLEAGAIDDPAVSGEFLGRIVGEIDRLAALVNELLDLARVESGRMLLRIESLEPDDLIPRGAERLRPQIERARLRLEIDVAPDLPPVLADRTRIEQVLLNLIHNAIKFTPVGGTIAVSAGLVDDIVAISVRDSGIGIPEAEAARIFERFFKTDRARRSEGTGLGLAIAKHIVLAHHGTISVTSQVGLGSTFTFTLPVVAQAKPNGSSAPAVPIQR